MVIKINSNLFNQNENVNKIDTILGFILQRRYGLFFDDESVFENALWINEARANYKELLYESFVHTLESSVEYDIELKDEDNISNNEYSIDNAIVLLESSVIIFLENAKYDSYFIKGLISNFKNKGKKLETFLSKRWVKFENCGGKNNVINQISHVLSSYEYESLENFNYLRAIVIIDSDKKHKDDEYQDDNEIIEFCHSNNIILHILEKREMENYLPLELFEDIDTLEKSELERFKKLTFEERDYYDMEKLSTKEYSTKKNFPKLFSNERLSQEMIKKQCSHQNEPNEPIIILEKINSLL